MFRYDRADRTKSDFFQDLLPALNARRVELLDHSRTISQLLALERSTSRLGKGRNHPSPGGHDLISAVAGALVLAPKCQMFEGYGQEATPPVTTAAEMAKTARNREIAEERERWLASQGWESA